MKNIAVILAGGSGTRLGETVPKQFIKIAGKKVIEHTIAVFQAHKQIDEICVVAHADYMREIEQIRLANSFSKLRKVLSGGKERYESSLSAIGAYSGEGECNLIFHDSVRPLVNDRIITDCIHALERYNAVDVAVPTTDTIIQVNTGNEIVGIPPRQSLRNGQTPQAFRLSTIKAAYGLALQDPAFTTTDDCGVVLKYLPDEPIHVVRGEMFNMKLTYKEDIFLLDKLFQLKSVTDFHDGLTPEETTTLEGRTIAVFGGTQGIGKEIIEICRTIGMNAYPISRSTGVDVRNAAQIASALKKIDNECGQIDFVVNTAGILTIQALNLMTDDEVKESIGINYLGCINVAKEAYEYLRKSKGSLLLYTSSSYTRGRAMYSLYSSLKAAIVNFVQAISEEWSGKSIRVNCINPERTLTPMRVKNFGIEPEGSLLDARTVAVASLKTLVSDMTGEVIDVRRKKMSIISKCLKWLRHSLRNAVVFPLSFIMPRSRHKWLFGSNMGFAGNAKYLFIYLNEHPDEGIRPLWIAKNRQELKQMKAMGLEAFRRWSAKGTYHALTSKYYLYNSYATDLHTVAMGRAVKVNLWHGVGIKNIEYAISLGPLRHVLYTDSLRQRIDNNWHFIKPDIFLSTSPMMTRHFAKCFRIPQEACIESAYPRNLIFKADKKDITAMMHRYESEPTCATLDKATQFKHIYIYMPTMRDSGGDFFKSIGWDFNDINNALKASKSCLIIKTHPITKLDISAFEYSNIFTVDKDADVYPILALSDTLITDYSSVYYDYILMPGKETLLLIPDIKEYMSTDRDLAFPFHEMTAGKKLLSTAELADHIRSGGEPSAEEQKRNREIASLFWAFPNDSCHELICKIKDLPVRKGSVWFVDILKCQPRITPRHN